MARLFGRAVVAAGAFSYIGGFVTGHLVDYDNASTRTQRLIELSWDVSLLLPLVGVGVAAHLWPRWWLVLFITAFMFLWPLGAYEVEIATGLEEPLGEGCDPCIDTTFLSILALPAFLVGAVSCAAARWRHHRVVRRRVASHTT
jgi:hypothetical protein